MAPPAGVVMPLKSFTITNRHSSSLRSRSKCVTLISWNEPTMDRL